MSSQEDINAVVARWRRNVKGKFRGIASFEERAELRFNIIKSHIATQRVRVDDWQFRQARYRRWGEYEFLHDWKPIHVGDTWGGEDMTAFFRQSVTVPEEFAGKPLALEIFLGGDSLMKVNGVPYHGMDLFRSEVRLTDKAEAGAVYDIEIESYMNFTGSSPKENEILASDLVTIDPGIRDAYWDLWCAAKVLSIPDIDPRLQAFVEHHLWQAMKLIPLGETDAATLRERVLAAQRMVRETVYATDHFKSKGLMHLVGHSHLDVVFMWPYKEFIRKVGRTHATMLRLMEQYPEFRFCQSQAKIYADMKEYYPELFEQVKQRVAEGRWELMGALWVEPDCNLVSGESFVRQILHGQRFFRENFGLTSRTCWQPDVFGLSWSLPQILARSGVRYFVTNKMVPWNDTNPWTMNTFWWEGYDGSRVLGIVPPGHFIGTVDPDVIDKQWRSFSDKNTIGETLHIYGWGDGGGGVDPEMIESGRRYLDFPGLVPMRFSSAEEAFERIERKARNANLPVLRDEIYLEAHRGTYTHKGRLKKLNRRAEFLYRDAELLAAFASLEGTAYPVSRLDAGWKDILTAQFHDSLPGTHVPQAYADLLDDYKRIRAVGEAVRDESLTALLGEPGDGEELVVLNSQPFARTDILRLPEAAVSGRVVTDPAGSELPQQAVTDLEGAQWRLVAVRDVPSVGFRRLRVREGVPTSSRADADAEARGTALENALIRAEFSPDGELVSLLDKENDRQVLQPGEAGNRFQMFEDTPGKYDAWDIVETYMDHPVELHGDVCVEAEESGPVRASLRLTRMLCGSRVEQKICLYAGSRELVFETKIDWVERQRLLKVAFPVDINASTATYDIAYGNMPRPTHRNTSFDRAKFEVPAHLWMDLSQHDYGVSMLNDCKYGCDIHESTMRLTLLKGSIHPDPKADMETHTFTYTLYPHAGGWREARTHDRALQLNCPLLAHGATATGAEAADGRSLLSWDVPGLTLEAVKLSEDGQAVIVRAAERWNTCARGSLTFGRNVRSASLCNLMEEIERDLPVAGNRVDVSARPYEILTIRLVFE